MKKNIFTLLNLPQMAIAKKVIKRFPFPINLTGGKYDNIEIIINNSIATINHKNKNLNSFSFIWLNSPWSQRDIAWAIDIYLNHFQTPHSNVEKNSSKITDYMIFVLNNIPVPNSVFVSKNKIKEKLSLIEKICGYPLIIKDIRGSQGRNCVYASNKKEFVAKIEKLPKNKKIIFQSYIENDYDWGIIVANGKVKAGEKSYHKKGEFRNNAYYGAKEYFIALKDIPLEIKNIAIKSSKLLNLSWSRADIIINKKTQRPYLLEVNRCPTITSQPNEINGVYSFLASHINKQKIKK